MSPMEQGVALLGAGRFHEAHQQFAEALRLQPLAAEPRVGLSQACEGMGDALTAAAWLSDACRVAPERAQLWMLQADLLLRHKQYVQALVPYAQLYAHQARDRATLLHYGFCLEQVGELEGAVARYREAIAREPGFMEAHVDLAGVLWRLEDFEGALAHARTAVQLAPQHPYAVRVLGSVLFNLNRVPEAEAELRRALELLPGFSLAEVDLAFTLLLAGRLDEGWPMYALRWRDTDRLARPPFFREELEWKGRALQPLRGKRVAVYAEQGLGDVIQFIRYASLLQQAAAGTLHLLQAWLADPAGARSSARIALADALGAERDSSELRFARDILNDWLAEAAKSAASAGDRVRLASANELWDKAQLSLADADEYNLDMRQTLVAIFDAIRKHQQLSVTSSAP